MISRHPVRGQVPDMPLPVKGTGTWQMLRKLQVLPAGGYPRTPFSRQSLSNPPSPPSPLFIRWGLKPLSKPLAILARGLQPLLLVALSFRYARGIIAPACFSSTMRCWSNLSGTCPLTGYRRDARKGQIGLRWLGPCRGIPARISFLHNLRKSCGKIWLVSK